VGKLGQSCGVAAVARHPTQTINGFAESGTDQPSLGPMDEGEMQAYAARWKSCTRATRRDKGCQDAAAVTIRAGAAK
jgi:hypothetical protein